MSIFQLVLTGEYCSIVCLFTSKAVHIILVDDFVSIHGLEKAVSDSAPPHSSKMVSV